jgi:hypothetical protein
MFLSAVSVLVVEQPSSEIPEKLMHYPVYRKLVLEYGKMKGISALVTEHEN